MSHRNFNLEPSNISLYESMLNGVDLNSNMKEQRENPMVFSRLKKRALSFMKSTKIKGQKDTYLDLNFKMKYTVSHSHLRFQGYSAMNGASKTWGMIKVHGKPFFSFVPILLFLIISFF